VLGFGIGFRKYGFRFRYMRRRIHANRQQTAGQNAAGKLRQKGLGLNPKP
jgi:hypothetical protein